jgi:hypothetical protein
MCLAFISGVVVNPVVAASAPFILISQASPPLHVSNPDSGYLLCLQQMLNQSQFFNDRAKAETSASLATQRILLEHTLSSYTSQYSLTSQHQH